MVTCVIVVLGSFRVVVDGRQVPDDSWKRTKAAGLVKILALAEGRQVHRDVLADQLWPDLSGPAAGANLRKALHFARAALGSPDAVQARGDLLVLLPDADVSIDAERFESEGRAALASSAGVAPALALYGGELLPDDRFAVWAEAPRDRLRTLYLRLLKAAGRWDDVLKAEPTDEEAHRAIMVRALGAGDRQSAIRQFEQLCRELRADLGIGPSAETVAVYEEAIAEDRRRAEHRARATLARALIALNRGDLDEASSSARRARELAISANLGREIGEASAVLGIAANMQNRWPEVFEAEFEDFAQGDSARADYVLDAQLCLADYCLCGPDGHRSIAQRAARLRTVAEQTGSLHGQAIAELLLGVASLFSGDLDGARRFLESALELHRRAGAKAGEILTRQRLAELDVLQDRRPDAAREASRALTAAESTWLEPHLVVRLYGVLAGAARSPAEAVRVIERADAALAGRSVCSPCSMGYHVAAATSYALAGRLATARRRLATAEQLAGMWPGGPWHAALWEARAVLRQAEGHDDQANALFREAAAGFAELGRPLDELRCLTRAERRPSLATSGTPLAG
ncbi:BTAD domain-containing putative transcriptional regulator [Sinomonas sp. JGH33]|uniref:BTAD domain-containing putative transcriptional regulator n=1 Tax=Sinomonas terricola TaxID=3110330 RepID=A0ABU5T3C1_9MICC|nr:BTAD domain-containing putative transcriptional regulator [Sinomonas sp. JGH33]MEA5453971.1 BTAD domain-containing putative transcriptional regulator [Sinomonas sp. JGH33]